MNLQDRTDEARADEERSTQQRASILGFQYLDTRGVIANAPLLKDILSTDEMYQLKAIPYSQNERLLTFVITTRTPRQTIENLKSRFADYNLSFLIISETGFKEYMHRYDPPKVVHYDDIALKSEGVSETVESVSQTLETVRSEEILNYLITQADRLGASDIHFENAKDYVRMRFRVDGTLHLIAKLSKDKYRQLQSSVASKANVSVASPTPQTGHFTKELSRPDGTTRSLNMRVETVPTNFGQDDVIRIFNLTRELMKLDNLGLTDYQQQALKDVVSHPHGMVLVVGPTGSGKTTTLYSLVDQLNNPQRKIVTLEDPVEYAFDGVTQVPVKSREGATFADMLRAVLRVDPDVIMIGEIRDLDTAKTALQASLTGHLVLSTFHASNASTALTRLLDVIGENPLFASAIRLIVAQRLVRRLDDETKQPYQPDEHLQTEIRRLVESLPDGITRPDTNQITLYKPGKSEASPFGYSGRIMISEQLVMSPELRTLLRGNLANISSDNIQKLARQQGMVTLLQDAILKALQGQTSIEEVYRVVDA